MRTLSVLLLCVASATAADLRSGLVGTWVVEGEKQPKGSGGANEYLPPGLRMQIKIQPDELTLLPPLPPELCSTTLGARVCEDGKAPTQAVTLDAVISYTLWDKEDADMDLNSFFTKRGAHAGSAFATIMLPLKALEWDLWIKDDNSLIGRYLSFQGTEGTPRETVLTWKKEKAAPAQTGAAVSQERTKPTKPRRPVHESRSN